MAALNHVVRRLGRVLQAGDAADTTDAELLKRYVRRADAAAFEALVRRHGPLVLGVCRRVLRDAHAAEDAFQATFLVLLRKARSIRSPGTLGNWLYGVAYRTALHARHAAAHRRSKEAEMAARLPTPDDSLDEWRALLDQELARLPEPLRAAIVLCELQGLTRREAARQLGCAEGTVASRLGRGRALLAKRLRRYGADLTGAALTALLGAQAASAAVRPDLVSSTMHAVGLHAVTGATAGAAAKAAVLADGVLRTMLLAKLKAVLAALLLVATAGGGAGLLLHVCSAAPGGDRPADFARNGLGATVPGRVTDEPRWAVAPGRSAPGEGNPPNARPQSPPTRQPVPGDPPPDVDPPDAVEALAARQVQLERDAAGRVVHALLPSRSPRIDEVFAQLKRLPRLAWVSCNADSITTDSFGQLASLPALVQFELHANERCPPFPWTDLRGVRLLRLSGPGIGDGVLKAVSEMPALTSVHLNEVKISADGYGNLQRLRDLDEVLIQKSQLTADGIRQLAGVRKLRTLTVAGNKIGPAGFAQLGTVTDLEYLNVESTGCTDADIASLLPLTGLRHLDLGYNPQVSDAGVRPLGLLRRLAGLRLYETRVTDTGVAELKKALPNLSVGR